MRVLHVNILLLLLQRLAATAGSSTRIYSRSHFLIRSTVIPFDIRPPATAASHKQGCNPYECRTTTEYMQARDLELALASQPCEGGRGFVALVEGVQGRHGTEGVEGALEHAEDALAVAQDWHGRPPDGFAQLLRPPGDAALVEGAARLGAGETTHIHNGIVVREGEFEVDGRCSHAEGDPEIALAIALHHHAS
mmetsp:Transcript_4837/g.17530  ORF Transcript_4837/g.17530 Transcript_4837/m.17530 type:complete len:194 (-) Transcript_4837:58-639(-)